MNNEEIKILPCPKCDFKDIQVITGLTAMSSSLKCPNCNYTRGGISSLDGLIRLWNAESVNGRANRKPVRIYIPFGDWSNDGHGRYEKVMVLAQSEENLRQAVDNIREKFGRRIFDEIANDYGDSSISENIYNILVDNGYDFTKIGELEDVCDDYVPNGWQEYIKNEVVNGKCGLMLETIEDIYFFLLRLGGAKFEVCPQDIPMFTYESVGYGCFYD